MAVADVMSIRLVSVAPEAALGVAVRRMLDEGVGSVAVCEGARLVGILTERDVLRLFAHGTAVTDTKVADVMTTDLITAPADSDIMEVARIMGTHNIRHLPILEGDNMLGMVGVREVVDVLAERLWRSQEDDVRSTVQQLLGTLRQRTAQRG